MTLLAFGDGESISEECYFGDTLYYILEGALYVSAGEDSRCLQTGDCLAVPAHTPVSYTHLDVYKRQGQQFPHGTGACLLSSQRSPGGANIEKVFR